MTPPPPVLKPLPRAFYLPAADKVAPRLLGHWLVRRTTQGLVGGLIVETEAYLADDPACHAFGGKTMRNRAMFGEPGRAYVYLIYGLHFCVNAVCQPCGVGEAVLIRALEPALGSDLMKPQRAVKKLHDLASGPAKLCQALQINRAHDAVDLCDAESSLFIAENHDRADFLRLAGPVAATTRIGITKAAHLPLRFCLASSPFLSRRPGKFWHASH